METYNITEDNRCLLPVGIYRDGGFIREVVIDEFRGIDQERLTSPTARNNSSKAITSILQRIVQSIGDNGQILSKSDVMLMCEDRHITNMFEVDREFLMLQSLAVSGEVEREDIKCLCKKCRAEFTTSVNLTELKVTPHDHTKPPQMEVELERGIQLPGRVISKGVYKYPTGDIYHRVSGKGDVGEHAIMSELISGCFLPFDPGNDQGQKLKNLTPEMVKRMSMKDRNLIIKTVSEHSPGVDTSLKRNCSSCGFENDVQVDISNFFI